jgi:hypothetical protein
MNRFKNVSLLLYCFIVLLALVYLLLPAPAEPPPLPESTKSNLPGDTVEIPHLYAYFTNLSREEVMAFYREYYSHSRLLNLPLPSLILNHPPEYTWVVIRDTEHSSYLEEIVHPFRDSFYINGYEPANDPFVKPEQRRPTLIYEGQEYKAKILVLPVYSNPLIRIVLFLAVIAVLVFIKREVIRLYGSFRHRR